MHNRIKCWHEHISMHHFFFLRHWRGFFAHLRILLYRSLCGIPATARFAPHLVPNHIFLLQEIGFCFLEELCQRFRLTCFHDPLPPASSYILHCCVLHRPAPIPPSTYYSIPVPFQSHNARLCFPFRRSSFCCVAGFCLYWCSQWIQSARADTTSWRASAHRRRKCFRTLSLSLSNTHA